MQLITFLLNYFTMLYQETLDTRYFWNLLKTQTKAKIDDKLWIFKAALVFLLLTFTDAVLLRRDETVSVKLQNNLARCYALPALPEFSLGYKVQYIPPMVNRLWKFTRHSRTEGSKKIGYFNFEMPYCVAKNTCILY